MNTSVINLDKLGMEMLYAPAWNPSPTGLPTYPPENMREYDFLINQKGYIVAGILISGIGYRQLQYTGPTEDGYYRHYVHTKHKLLESIPNMGHQLGQDIMNLNCDIVNFVHEQGTILHDGSIYFVAKDFIVLKPNPFPEYDAFLES